MSTQILSYLIVVGFIFISESLLRKSGKARSFKQIEKYDKTSLLFVFTVFLVLTLAPLLNYFDIGVFNNLALNWLGIVFLIIGIAIRVYAMWTLGSQYTRAVIVSSDYRLIDSGFYKYIRHPGYLGTIIAAVGFCLAQANWIILFIALILMFVIYVKRIGYEEELLKKHFGNKYSEYSKRTKRLIPFIY